jgi:hypothetical protein
MDSPAKDFADYLLQSDSSVNVTAFGVDVFVGLQPKTPQACVTLYNTGGWGNAPNYVYEKPTVMALVRSSTYAAGYALALAIKHRLHGKYGVVINSARYIQIMAEGDIQDLGIEQTHQCHEFSINFAAHRTTTS